LMMTAVPVLIMRGAITQIIIVLLVSLSCVAAYMELKPYTTASDNTVAVLSQWAITLTLIVSILIRIGEEQGLNRQSLGIIAILINSSVFVVTILLIFFGNDEYNPTEDFQNFERQLSPTKKRSIKMKLSSFIEGSRESIEATGEKQNGKALVVREGDDNIGTELINLKTDKVDRSEPSSLVSRRSWMKMKSRGSSHERTTESQLVKESSPTKRGGRVPEAPTPPQKEPSRSRNGARGSILNRRGSVKAQPRAGPEEKEAESIRPSSISHEAEQRVSRLVKRDEKDSDDESDSDDDHGDSDDDHLPTSSNNHAVVSNPISRGRI
jgi:hypothetical protein